MIIYNKRDNYFVVSADRQTFLAFEMTVHLRDAHPLKGKYHGVLISFVKNDEIRPSISCQIILE